MDRRSVGQTLASAGTGDLPIACRGDRTGKFGEPVGGKASPTFERTPLIHEPSIGFS